MKFFSAIKSTVQGWFSRPDQELSRWQRIGMFAVALAMHCAGQLRRDRAPQMAAALAYKTLFGLIPTLVLSLILLRFFYGDDIKEPLQRVIEYIGLSDVAVPVEDEVNGALNGMAIDNGEVGAVVNGAASSASPADLVVDKPTPITPEEVEENERLGAWIQMLVNRVSEINFAAVGVVGVVVLIVAALSLMMQIDQAFNIVFKSHTNRKIVARVTQYWTILTLGPLGIVASFWISDRFNSIVESLGGSALVTTFGVLAAFFVSWLVLLLAFMVVPLAKVRLSAALVGSFVAAALWETGKWGFSLYLGFSTGYARFYGSLALIPIFMLWVYITWLIVLFGLELTYAMQTFESGLESFRDQKEKSESHCQTDPLRGLAVISAIAEAFERGDSISATELCAAAAVAPDSVHEALKALEKESLIHQIERPDDEQARWTLARPPEKIRLTQVFSVLAPESDGESAAACKASEAMRMSLINGLGDQTLRDLLSGQDGQG